MAITTREEVYLDYIYKIKCVGKGQLKYLLDTPEFRKRLSEISKSGAIVDEAMLHKILTQMKIDVQLGVVSRDSVPISKLNNMINRLERSIHGIDDKVKEEVLN